MSPPQSTTCSSCQRRSTSSSGAAAASNLKELLRPDGRAGPTGSARPAGASPTSTSRSWRPYHAPRSAPSGAAAAAPRRRLPRASGSRCGLRSALARDRQRSKLTQLLAPCCLAPRMRLVIWGGRSGGGRHSLSRSERTLASSRTSASGSGSASPPSRAMRGRGRRRLKRRPAPRAAPAREAWTAAAAGLRCGQTWRGRADLDRYQVPDEGGSDARARAGPSPPSCRWASCWACPSSRRRWRTCGGTRPTARSTGGPARSSAPPRAPGRRAAGATSRRAPGMRLRPVCPGAGL